MRQASFMPADIAANEQLVKELGITNARRAPFGRLSFPYMELSPQDLVDVVQRWARVGYSPGWRHEEIVEHLKRIAPTVTTVPVLYMDDQALGPRVRTCDDLGFVNLFQGRDLGPSSPDAYPGDRHVPDDSPETVALQIHFVTPRNRPGVKVHTLALHLGDVQRAWKVK